jgi:hypothetical protein
MSSPRLSLSWFRALHQTDQGDLCECNEFVRAGAQRSARTGLEGSPVLEELKYKKFQDGAGGLIGAGFGLLRHKGLHPGNYFEGWMRERLAATGFTRFGQLRLPPADDEDPAAGPQYRLQVIGSDLTHGPGRPPRWPTFGLLLVAPDDHDPLVAGPAQAAAGRPHLVALVPALDRPHDDGKPWPTTPRLTLRRSGAAGRPVPRAALPPAARRRRHRSGRANRHTCA